MDHVRTVVLLLICGAMSSPARAWVKTEAAAEPTLFDNVVHALGAHYYDASFRERELPALVARYKGRAARATTLEQQREVVHALLRNVPASHLALISAASKGRMIDELAGRPAPTFGFELIEYDGKHYAFNVLEDGPADQAGLRRGDRIVTIDGMLVDDSPRLDWRTDDAYLPDPPVRYLNGELGELMDLDIERTPGHYLHIEVPYERYSAWQATNASARIVERDGRRIGLIHFWFIHFTGPDTLLKEKLEGDFASCDALVLDLRGRGGSGMMIRSMLDVLDGTASDWNKPVVSLINGHSRSAKEIIAYGARKRGLGSLVGERTCGAVIPATMADVGFDMFLMFPAYTLPRHTKNLEFRGVEPDVLVEEVGPYSAGADPILAAGIAEAVRLARVAVRTSRPAHAIGSTSSATSMRSDRAHGVGDR